MSHTLEAADTLASAAELRRRRGYSITDLAETCGLTEQEIARIEAGEVVAVPYLVRIAAALRFPVDSMREYRRLHA
ncbi:helix-turn-helix domain-containing protein [Gellertiella hungarica]|uniref:Transcriptional regulator with XRE-family HTH domain n=1 Tax=Gellertiella hungarica TaxID=1572859 RepID=A0A7W6NIZ4_9HYPH|nr:helix-turn-helix transcriptional regulator [Gellertiella hungarica]MBB4063233.1 transcriptional regulator with XRE-family HTH domain [Gellertiella hungarica]